MAIKTISVELDAYDLLVRARLHPKESFSSVVRRAKWDEPQYTGRALLVHMRARMRRGLVLSESSLGNLAAATGRRSAPRMPDGILTAKADTFLVDTSFLTELELEVGMITEGPAIRFVADNEASVYQVSVTSCGEFIGHLATTDTALGNQILSRFQPIPLTPAVIERYGREIDPKRPAASTDRRTDNERWVASTAVALDSPLLTRRADRFFGVEGLRIVPLQ